MSHPYEGIPPSVLQRKMDERSLFSWRNIQILGQCLYIDGGYECETKGLGQMVEVEKSGVGDTGFPPGAGKPQTKQPGNLKI
jgi:hypothetical protein